MTIKGTVENIIFRNDENGYSVIELDSNGQPVTITGNFPMVSEGQLIEAEGEFQIGKYGSQFCCDRVKYHSPATAEAITRYLASGLIKGVGQVTAAAITDKFGEKTLEIIETNPSLLAEVRGISLKKAAEIGANVLALKDMQNTVMFLQGYGITVGTALKIYKAYGGEAQNILKENPYRLVEDVEGIGFITADKIAARLGIEKTSDFRIRAGLVYVLKDFAENTGSTYIPLNKLTENLTALLDIDFSDNEHFKKLDGIIDGLVIDGLLRTSAYGENTVMLSIYYNMEKSIASRLARLLNFMPQTTVDMDFFIDEYEKTNGISLHAAQKNAVKAAITNGVCVITGGPGTGKTTIIKCILYILRQQGGRTLLCAPTGRAAKRLSESTGEEAKTIHRMLDLSFKTEGYFTYNESTKLEADTVIVDEMSMVDEYLFNSLIKALKEGTRLILVGDKDQLPSVGAGSVLKDVITSGCVKTEMLTEIYRQDKESLIVLNAHAVNNGIMPEMKNKNSDFFFLPEKTPQEMLETIKGLCLKRLPEYLNCAPSAIQILAPMKKGVCGVENLNSTLQALINPPASYKKEILCEGKVLRQGDKVMQTVNNYKLKWTKNTIPFESGEGVFNGDIGYIINISSAFDVTVEFEDGRVAEYNAGETGDLVLAYAISVHKSQGCEFDAVVLPITGGPPTLLTRNLLYTAITRAKKLVVLVGSAFMVEKMVNNNYTERRYTFLSDFIKEQCRIVSGLLNENDGR
jgi:exodeoxyribonuclease V alpha subunit